jgi:hypothetical protein
MRRRRIKKDGGLNLLRDRKMEYSEVQALAQPPKCRGCSWGSFEGKQFCSKQKCVKEPEGR